MAAHLKGWPITCVLSVVCVSPEFLQACWCMLRTRHTLVLAKIATCCRIPHLQRCGRCLLRVAESKQSHRHISVCHLDRRRFAQIRPPQGLVRWVAEDDSPRSVAHPRDQFGSEANFFNRFSDRMVLQSTAVGAGCVALRGGGGLSCRLRRRPDKLESELREVATAHTFASAASNHFRARPRLREF